MKTLIGPIFGGLSVGNSGNWKWYFGLGRVFSEICRFALLFRLAGKLPG